MVLKEVVKIIGADLTEKIEECKYLVCDNKNKKYTAAIIGPDIKKKSNQWLFECINKEKLID